MMDFPDAEDIELNTADLQEDKGFLDVEFGVAADSGAGEHVADETYAPTYAVEESAGSKVGQHFVNAGGGKMPNKGQMRLALRADNGRRGRDVRTTFQVARVTRPLMSVSKVCDAGMTMRFDSKMAVILDANGKEVCRFMRRGGLYVAKMRLRNPHYKPRPDAGFARPGRK